MPDVRVDRVGRDRVDGHDGQVEYDVTAVEQAAFVTFVDHSVLEALGEDQVA